MEFFLVVFGVNVKEVSQMLKIFVKFSFDIQQVVRLIKYFEKVSVEATINLSASVSMKNLG